MTIKAKPGSIREMLKNGAFTCAEIARIAGVSRKRVYHVAAEERDRADEREHQLTEAKLPFADRRVALLPLSERTRNCCFNAEITYGRDLLRWRAIDLLRLRNFGRKCLDEVRALLEANGLPSEHYRLTSWSAPAPEPAPPRPIAPPRVIVVMPTARGTH